MSPAVLSLVLIAMLQPGGADNAPGELDAAALIERLDDPDYETRTRAMYTLDGLEDELGFIELARALDESDPSAERRARLMTLLESRFRREPKGGLGVGFGPDRLIGVEIANVVDNPDAFPATAQLEEGDVLLVADGELLLDPNDLRVHILSHVPGGTLELIVERSGERLNISAVLGSYTQLRGAAPLESSIAQRALTRRLARLGLSLPERESIGSTLTRDDWFAAAYPDSVDAPVRERAPGFPNVLPGGSGTDTVAVSGGSTRDLVNIWSSKDEALLFFRRDTIGSLMVELNEARWRLYALELREQILDDELERAQVRETIDELRVTTQTLDERIKALQGSP